MPDAALFFVLCQAAGGSDLTGAALGQLFERLGQPLDAAQEALLRERFDVAGRDHRVSFSEARLCPALLGHETMSLTCGVTHS